MTASISLYEGTAQGTRAQVAVRGDAAFVRHWISRGRFGYGWSKWSPTTPVYPTHVYSKIEGQEHIRYDVAPRSRVECGFENLPIVTTDAKGIRLPK